MPWKVFTQSLALTDFGDKLTNDQFIQRQNTSYYLNIAPKRGDSVFELFLCYHLETHFEVIQKKSAHIDPSTPCDSLCFGMRWTLEMQASHHTIASPQAPLQ